MKNRQAVERFEQEAHNSQIETLIWVASTLQNQRNLECFLQEMPEHDFDTQLPELWNSGHFEDYRERQELSQMMIDFQKFGFLAEVNIPTWYGMNFDNKNRSSTWSVKGGVFRVVYLYAETITELMKKIEKVATQLFKEFETAERQRLKDFPKSA